MFNWSRETIFRDKLEKLGHSVSEVDIEEVNASWINYYFRHAELVYYCKKCSRYFVPYKAGRKLALLNKDNVESMEYNNSELTCNDLIIQEIMT